MPPVNTSALIAIFDKVDKSDLTDAERQQLLAASQELLAKLENPWDTIKRLVWINVRVYPKQIYLTPDSNHFSVPLTAMPTSLSQNSCRFEAI